jgi:hypothetical protein
MQGFLVSPFFISLMELRAI